MYFKRIILGAIVFLCTPNAQSSANFCSSPFNYVCDRQKNDAQTLAEKSRITFFHSIKAEIDTQLLKTPNLTARTESLEVFLLEKLGGLEGVELSFARLKDVMIQAVMMSNVTNKQKMIERLNSVKIGFGSEYLAKFPDDYVNSCGEDGLKVNAVGPVTGPLICPGVLLAAAAAYETKRFKDPLAAVTFMLLHEIGHTIDNESDSEFIHAFDEYLSCAESNYGSDNIITHGGAREIIADQWAAKAISILVRGYTDLNMAEHIFSDVIKDQCEYKKLPFIHQPIFKPELRFDVLIMGNPDLREAFRCESEVNRKTCGFPNRP